ncbi:T9SS type A sorting domain-containing protein [Flavobacterium sp.]|uniref:PKD domain-containing protein n=1 Tax=Flavobacterium sp. TaxID=239 RepID=UPI00261D4811|nr:T9SS type A sorting domain-containing protein [Flavobacterium sp.]
MKKYFLILVVTVLNSFGQNLPNGIETNLSPNGVLENVFDHYGNKYKLTDIVVGKEIKDENGQILRSTNPLPMTCGYFNLYFEDGCGMENTSIASHMARRAVVCQVFTDLSNFINTPLTTNGLNNKVNIWVRNINNIVPPESSSDVLGLASSFYSMPYNTTAGFGGIVDNEIWKTIHTGVDSYTNVVSPLVSSAISSGTSGIFYHGMMAFNFNATTPPINWNTNLSITSFPDLYDLYSVVLHEVTHSLGFASLISSTGTSKFNSGYNYYNRYDRFLKNNANTQFLLTSSGCGTGTAGSMYNYGFNPALNTSILQPNPTSCSNSIRFVGLTNVQVYTPTAFSPPSSLSHFEGTCVLPNPNFTLTYSMDTNVIRRFLKPQERNALGNIGYSLKTSYGVSTTYQGTAIYTGGVLTGVSVAGVNDGLNSNGTFKYIGTAGTPIVINSSTDTSKRILSNDTSTSTNFECLQDVFDTTATFTATSGVGSTTNVSFTSSVPGLHLLRYVPRNSTGTQKGNITYIYVYVDAINNCVSMNACDYIGNGNFESYSSLPSELSQVNLSCGWFNAHFGSADYMHSSATSSMVDVPCNYFGFENDNILSNGAYVGMLFSVNGPFNNHYYESIRTKLKTPLSSNSSYQLSFDVSLAEGVSMLSNKFQAYLSKTIIATAGAGEIPISNPNMLKTNSTFSTCSNGWEKIVLTFNTDSIGGEEYLYLGGLNGVEEMVKSAATSIDGCLYYNFNGTNNSYYYVDNVSLIPLNGGSFTLPSTLCQQQILSNLNTYLDGLPTNGVFSGTGVVYSGGVYSLNSTSMPFGVNTISYTYTNSSGCSVTIYSNITIEDCGCNCLSTMYFTYTNVGNTVTFNVLNTNPNCTLSSMSPLRLYWEFGDGTSVFNGGTTFTHTYPTAGSYLVKLSPRIMGPADEVICSRTGRDVISNTVVTSSGRSSVDLINQNTSDNVSIYPNPTTSKFNINIENNIDKKVLVVVRTIEGKEIFKETYNLKKGNQTIEVELSPSVSDGLVLVEVSSSNIKVSKNLLIKN